MSKIYDVIILGAGPAGLSAGLYAGRYKLSALIIEKSQDGGQISVTDEVENYPGQVIDSHESGTTLVARMTAQAAKFGCERVSANITSVDFEGDIKKLTDAAGNVYCVIRNPYLMMQKTEAISGYRALYRKIKE